MLDHLNRSGVDEEITSQLIDEMRGELQGTTLGDLERMEVLLKERIAARMRVSGPVRGRERRPVVVALVGPTGVGKTTTLAKLAANTKFMAEREVALISADTYRIAAVDQLRAFARIADIPMEVVYAPLEMEQAVEKHRDKALVLIDTAGRSPWNAEQLLELKEYMVHAQPDEIHLVISLTSKESDVFDAVDRFGVVPIDRVLFTKLDETSTFGSMLNIVQRIGKPVSYVTNGQRVPEDIRLARSEELARLVLAGKLSAVSDAGRWGTDQAPQTAWLKGSSRVGTLDG
jgi:flagellar biosynthesis protein FlhF